MISDLDLSLLIDQLVIDYKATGKSREWIEQAILFEVQRSCEEQFDEE
jgi:hypothetical protein